MKYLLPLLLLLSCSQPSHHDKIIAKDSTPQVFVVSTGGVYCCDTVRTLNHTAIVKSVIDTNGMLIEFKIVKVLP